MRPVLSFRRYMERNESLWMATAPEPEFPALTEDVSTDVVVVGGGIAGICAAWQLAQTGIKVIVLEANRVCAGVTGYTTAKVTSGHGLKYAELFKTCGGSCAQAYADANQWGIEWIADEAKLLGIECNLERKPMLVFADTEDQREAVRDEVDKARNVGLPVSWTDNVDLPLQTWGAIRYENQLQFHPRKFVLGLARELKAMGGHIYEGVVAERFEEGEPCIIHTSRGIVTAHEIVIASHFPAYDPAMYFTRLAPYRDYAVATRIQGAMPTEMSIGASENSYAFRSYEDLLIVSGETHKVGQEPDTEARYQRLEEFVQKHFPASPVVYRWSTQDNSTLDGIPYIGRISGNSEHAFVITGFNAWGMSTAAYGGKLICDLIQGQNNDWADTFDPNRSKGSTGVTTFAKENLNVAKHLIGDKLQKREELTLDQLQPGEGEVLKVDGEKLAVFRDEQGAYHGLSPLCTHMGCDLAWNNAEQTWDCPCHGSRFDIGGEVIHGPALKSLEKKPVKTSGPGLI